MAKKVAKKATSKTSAQDEWYVLVAMGGDEGATSNFTVIGGFTSPSRASQVTGVLNGKSVGKVSMRAFMFQK